MAATIELKYYNSFWLKKIASITKVIAGEQTSQVITSTGNTITLASGLSDTEMNVGQSIKILYDGPNTYNGFITKRIDDNNFEVSPIPSPAISGGAATATFGEIEDFTNIPRLYTGSNDDDWFIEESRIRGGYNNTTVDFGVKAYAVNDVSAGEIRSNSLIYSGIFNSRTGVNNTNQFSIADSITKSVDPSGGSIQKLYAEDTNLIVFQENKVSRALIDKDAIYSAEGGGTVTSSNLVIGQIVPYGGKYGISTEPESFAIYGYRKYFTDRRRNAVLRLSMDGIEEISRYGMTDFWRDELSVLSSNSFIVGGYDLHTKKYEVSVLESGQFTNKTPEQELGTYKTLSFDESVKGWTSFYSYAPDFIGSLKNDFYSMKNGKIYKHYSNPEYGFDNPRGEFYGNAEPASVEFIFNPKVSAVKNFKTINYEGDPDWIVGSIITNDQSGNVINKYVPPLNQTTLEQNLLSSQFLKKEGKYFANITNATPAAPGTVVFGNSMTGVKGFFAKVTMTLGPSESTQQRELFAVSTEYVESSY